MACEGNGDYKQIARLRIEPGAGGPLPDHLVRGERVEAPTGSTVLREGDIVRVVGKEENIDGVVLMLGHLTDKEIPGGELDMRRFVVTNRELVGEKIKDLKIQRQKLSGIKKALAPKSSKPRKITETKETANRFFLFKKQDSYFTLVLLILENNLTYTCSINYIIRNKLVK